MLGWALAQHADAVDILKIMKLAYLSPRWRHENIIWSTKAACDCGMGL